MKIYGDLKKREAKDIPNLQGYALTVMYSDGARHRTSVMKGFDGCHRIAHPPLKKISDVSYWQEGHV